MLWFLSVILMTTIMEDIEARIDGIKNIDALKTELKLMWRYLVVEKIPHEKKG